MPTLEQSVSPELNIQKHQKNKFRNNVHEEVRPHSTTETEISSSPHHSIKEIINPTLREALEALTLNLQTFMKYIDYHEKKNGHQTIFGMSTSLNTVSTSNSISLSMGNIDKTNAVSFSINYEYLQIDPQCIGDDEIILTEKEYKQLEEIYFNPIKYLSETLKILNERNVHEEEYREHSHFEAGVNSDELENNRTTSNTSNLLPTPLIIKGRARKRTYH